VSLNLFEEIIKNHCLQTGLALGSVVSKVERKKTKRQIDKNTNKLVDKIHKKTNNKKPYRQMDKWTNRQRNK
jgi:hypothetical protein